MSEITLGTKAARMFDPRSQPVARFSHLRPSANQRRVLFLSTYPMSHPKDGGQIRAAAEREVFRAAGFRVANLVIATDQWPTLERNGNGFYRSSQSLVQRGYPWVCWDLALGTEHEVDRGFRKLVSDRVRLERPDLVILDQPWLWPICRDLLSSVPVVYSSQNIEHRLKRAILELVEPESDIENWVERIRNLEIETLQGCVRTTAVSEEDSNWMQGYSTSAVGVARNGAQKRVGRTGNAANWRKHLDGRRIATFIASGHPPNAAGFWDILQPNLAFLAPDEAVVALGSVGEPLRAHPQFVKHRAVNNARLVTGGFQSESNISAVFEISHSIILPITLGEGSNLKTAEALISERLVIGTPRAFRGFEQYQMLSGVVIANDPPSFRDAIKESLGRPQQVFDRFEARNLLWSKTLDPLTQIAWEVVAS